MLQMLWTCNGLHLIVIYICIKRCSSPFGNLVSCSLLTSWFCSFSCLSYGDVIYGTFCLYSLSYVSYGVVIYGIFEVYLTTCTIVSTIDGSTLPLIIFCAFRFVFFCSLFNPKPKASPSSTLLFFLRTLGKSVAAFFMFSNVTYISSLILLTLVGGFYGFSF